MRIHFIGIGGIGVSALAKYYLVAGAAAFFLTTKHLSGMNECMLGVGSFT